jgi:hexokinase
VAAKVSKRATAILAAAVHALWQLTTNAQEGKSEDSRKMMIACHGSVIQSYPGFMANCQGYLDELVRSTGCTKDSLVLEEAIESSLLGAAVAVAAL